MPKKKPYRCQNPACSTDEAGRLIFDFWAEKPVCPSCGTDGAKMPQVVIELAVVHFDPPSNVMGRGLRIMACTKQGYGHQSIIVSGVPTSVNCPECRATEAWQRAAGEWEERKVTPEGEEAATEAFEAGRKHVEELEAALA